MGEVTDLFYDLDVDMDDPSGLYEASDESESDELYDTSLSDCTCGVCPLCLDDHGGLS